MAGKGGAIRTISANLTTDLFGWNTGLKKATNSLDSFYSTASARLNQKIPFRGIADVGKSLGGLGKSAIGLTGITKGLSSIGSVASGLAGPIAAIGLGVAAGAVVAGAAVAAMASGGIDRIDQLTDAAQRIGVTTEALSELRYAANLAGGDAETLDNALEKLNQNLGDSATKATPTSEALDRIGLSAKSLAKDSPDVAFEKIVGAFEKVPDAATKASLAADIFGKQGVKLVNVLSAGSGEIQRLREEAKKFGVSVSQVDAAKIAAAKDSLDRVGAVVEGIGNKLAVSLAPHIEATATAFTDWFGSVWDGGKIVDSVLDGMAGGFASILDGATEVGITFQSVFGSLSSWIGGAIESIGSLVTSIGRVVPGLDGIGKAITSAGVTVRTFGEGQIAAAGKADQAFQLAKPSAAFLKGYEDWKGRAQAAAQAVADGVKKSLAGSNGNLDLGGSIASVTTKLKEQIAAIGKTAVEMEIFKLKQQGATEAQLAGVAALAKDLKSAEAAKERGQEIASFGKSIAEKIRTPIETYAADLKKLDEAIASGDFTGDAGKARGSLAKDAGLGEVKLAGATEARSTQGYSAIVQAISGKGDGFTTLERGQQQGNSLLGNINGGINALAKALAKPTPGVAI